MLHGSPSRTEGRKLAHGRFHYRRSFDIPLVCLIEAQTCLTSDDDRSQWSAAHDLAVCAVANGRRFGIGFGLERHKAAVTASVDSHDMPLTIIGMIATPRPGRYVRFESEADIRGRLGNVRFIPKSRHW